MKKKKESKKESQSNEENSHIYSAASIDAFLFYFSLNKNPATDEPKPGGFAQRPHLHPNAG